MGKIVYRPHIVSKEFFPLPYGYVEGLTQYRELGVEFDTEEECQKECDKLNEAIKPIIDKR